MSTKCHMTVLPTPPPPACTPCTERLALEEKGRKAEAKIQEIQQNMDARLNSMPPSQRQQYYDLVAEQGALTQEAKRFEEAIDELDRQLNTQEGELARNPLKQRCVARACGEGCWMSDREGINSKEPCIKTSMKGVGACDGAAKRLSVWVQHGGLPVLLVTYCMLHARPQVAAAAGADPAADGEEVRAAAGGGAQQAEPGGAAGAAHGQDQA